MMMTQLEVMPRHYGRGMSLRPINSVKNIIDGTFLGVAAGVITTVSVFDVVNDYTGLSTQVPIGAKVSSIYLFVQIQPEAVGTNVDWYIWKGPGNISATMPTPGTTGGNVNRRYILHEEKGIPGTLNNGAPPLTFRGVIKIPKGRQRAGEADTMQIRIVGAAVYDACVKIIYKFYQ